MTDEELHRAYESVGGMSLFATMGDRHTAALRAVFLAGARAQREMEPTDKMLSELFRGYSTREDAYRAMQRAAPLAVDPNVREEG